MQKHVQISASDIQELATIITALATLHEKTINHGDENGDTTEAVVDNIVSDTLHCGIYRWASKFFPEFEDLAMNPEDSRFDDPKLND